MRFKSLLNMICEMLEEKETGKDAYNRPVFEYVPLPERALCRLDKLKRRTSSDEYGEDIITETILFLPPESPVKVGMKVSDIRDKHSNIVSADTYLIEDVQPVYKRVILHHFEVALKKE
ncbi:hypothetical protein SAMN05421743_105217 [Thalassobacillus cyri]|uniref:Uncharacterized protein n=1 Tax=Thalassobacillus cyri TaxID=571932 RepID=A0A1H4C0E7_9BACI|nr:hypothetical protein [Thalassobacillus cyri]SEA53819.1 hypothetical protein SAMN05421743_105217 [Thalassobacillus cyri]